MLTLTLMLVDCSTRLIEVGGELEITDTGDDRWQRGARFAVSRAPLDAWLDQKEDGFEAHLLDQTLGSGEA
jgi:hypothetical protein